jgi:hypothetical protein
MLSVVNKPITLSVVMLSAMVPGLDQCISTLDVALSPVVKPLMASSSAAERKLFRDS